MFSSLSNSVSDVSIVNSLFAVQRHRTSPSDPTSEELSSLVEDLVSRISKSTNEIIAASLTPWDARSEKVRTDESALGNFIADILMHSYDETLRERERRGELDCSGRDKNFRQVDCALLCGGALRGDSVYTTNITLGNVLEILPFEDATGEFRKKPLSSLLVASSHISELCLFVSSLPPIAVVKELSGQNIWDALENGLSAYPKQEGRFPVIAGLIVKWDSRKPPFSRLVSVDVLDDVHMLDDSGSKISKSRMYEYVPHPNDEGATIKVHRPTLKIKESLKMDQTYRVTTREYMAVDGHDGYKSLEEGKYIIDHENGVLASALVRKFLLGASLLWRLKNVRDGDVEEGEDEDETGDQTHMMDQSIDSIRSKATTNGDESFKKEMNGTLSKKTRKAIERARLLAKDEDEDDESTQNEDQNPSSESNRSQMQSSDPSSIATSSSSRNRSSSTSNDHLSTPSRTSRPQFNNRGKSEFLIRTVVDQSPGGIRDALHAGGYEHHSQRDPVHRRFNDPSSGHDRIRSSDGNSSESGSGSRLKSSSSNSNRISSPKLSKSSTVENQSSKSEKETVKGQDGESKRGVLRSNSEVMTEKIEVDQDEIEEMKSTDGEIAMVCPLRDGRLIDVARVSE